MVKPKCCFHPMKRVYVRVKGGAFVGIGWFCPLCIRFTMETPAILHGRKTHK